MTDIVNIRPYAPNVAAMQFAQINALVIGVEQHLQTLPQNEFEAELAAVRAELAASPSSLGGHFLVHLYINEATRRGMP